MYNSGRTRALTALAAGTLVILLGGSFFQSSFAVPPLPQGTVRAIQNGNSLDSEDNNQGVLGADIDCVGGITTSAGATSMDCYLVPEGVAPGNGDFLTDPSVVKQTTTTTEPCPTGVGFGSGQTCFVTTFDDSLFTPGDWHFVAVWFNGSTQINILGEHNFKVHSFGVIPESPLGIAALVGSSLAALAGYSYFRSKKGTQISGSL